MQRDPIIERQIDGWLSLWGAWSAAYRPALGYAKTAAGFRLYRAPGHHDATNGEADAKADQAEAEAIDAVIGSMDALHRAALSMEARNLNSGANVWRSARLPADSASVIAEARGKLWDGMAKEGLA